MQVWKRTGQVVEGKGDFSDSSIGRITGNANPIGSARIRSKIPVGVGAPERAASGIVKSNKRVLLVRRKGAPNRKNQCGE